MKKEKDFCQKIFDKVVLFTYCPSLFSSFEELFVNKEDLKFHKFNKTPLLIDYGYNDREINLICALSHNNTYDNLLAIANKYNLNTVNLELFKNQKTIISLMEFINYLTAVPKNNEYLYS